MTTTTPRPRKPLAALWLGLALTVGALIVLYADRALGDVLRGHIAAGYPDLSAEALDTAALMYLVYLSVLGGIGVLCWLLIIWSVSAGKRWARWVATAIFAVAACLALTNLTITDTNGEVGLAPLHGWVGLAPTLAGLLAVVLLWLTPRGRAGAAR